MNSPLFSVIMPVYNRALSVGEALDSVKAQTYRPIEIIAVDDGSTDATAEVLKKWAARNEEEGLRLRCFYQENSGAGAARNRGIQEVRGEYVQFFDSDDLLHARRLETLADIFEREQCDFIQTGFDAFAPETGETVEIHYGRLKNDIVSQALMGVLWPNTLRSAFRRSLVEKIGPWNTAMTCFEDYEYVIRALLASHKPFVIRDILASARRGGGARVSDRLHTREGRGFRIQCERLVARLAELHAVELSDGVQQEFAGRMYLLGVRSRASGWKDLARQCGEIADRVKVKKKSGPCLKWRCLWKLGALGGFLYNCMDFLRKVLKR